MTEDPTTLSGIPVRALYGPTTDGDDRIGRPGEPPFTRGIRADMYRSEPWVMGMYSGFATPSETNKRIRSLLARGQRGFSVALDLPTQNGLDSDHPLARGEVGRVGVPIDTVEDVIELLDGIALDEVSQIRTTANAIGPIAVALFVVAAEHHGHDAGSFRVMLQNDVLKEYIARGTYVFPPEPAVGFAVDVIEHCARHLPHWKPIEFCGYHIRDSGSTAVQEVAIATANGLEYLRRATERGLSVDDIGEQLFMFLAAHVDVFEEVAKFRAARRLWARLMKERFGVERDASRRLNLFVYTLGSPLVAQEPLNNIVRVAYQSMAAVLGGVQTLATSSFDEALGLPSEEAVNVALRTQQILATETGVTRTPDPLGGSYFVEALTDELEAAILELVDDIEERGGALASLQSGYLGRLIDEQAYAVQRAIDDGSRPVVGLNRYADGTTASPRDITTFRPDPSLEGEQIARVRAVRRARDSEAAAVACRAVEQAAREGRNTVPPIIVAVRARCTVGEICDALAEVWGHHDDRP